MRDVILRYRVLFQKNAMRHQLTAAVRKIDTRPLPTLISSKLLPDVSKGHKPPTSQVHEVPVYPMNKQNIKPYEVWVGTKGVDPKHFSFAYLTRDQTEYVKALQDNWNNTSIPPIRPEAPPGTTLHKALNSHCLETKERVPPEQAWKTSNNNCVNITRTWEATLAEKEFEPASPEAIDRDSSIQRCRELREELLAQRSNVEEMVSTKILLARAVWEHEAFKQIKKERARVEGLEAELAKVKNEKLAAQNALLDEVEKQQEKGDVHNFNTLDRLLSNEDEENCNLLFDWHKINNELSSQVPGDPMKLTEAFAMFPRFVSYIEKRKLAISQEHDLLGKLVDVKPFRNDKANLIGVTMETVVHDTLTAKADVEIRIRALKDQMASCSTVTSPGLPGMPSPPFGAAHEPQEDIEKRIEALEVEKSNKAYEWAVALTFSKYWKIYCPYKTAQGEPMDLSDQEEEEEYEEEQEYEDDSDYEEDPCAKLTAAKAAIAAEDGTSYVQLPVSPASITNIVNPHGISTERTMQWLYDVITHACQSWTEDVVRHRNALQKKQRENEGYEKNIVRATELLRRTHFQNMQAGKVNRKLRTQVKELETRIGEYINFMQKLGIESGKDLGSEECLYNSIQSLKALKDENLRSKILIDGLNERVADLARVLDLCEEAMVPWPSANRLEESLAESLQVYDHMFSQHKSWLRSLDYINKNPSLDEEVFTRSAVFPGGDDDSDIFTDGFAMLNAMAEGKPIPDLEARMTASRQTSPERRKPPGPYDERSLKALEISERINETEAYRARTGLRRHEENDQLSKEIQAMSGLVKLKEGRNTKFIERFEEVAEEVEEGFTLDLGERSVEKE